MSTMHACARRGAAVEAITHQGRLEVAPQAKLFDGGRPQTRFSCENAANGDPTDF